MRVRTRQYRGGRTLAANDGSSRPKRGVPTPEISHKPGRLCRKIRVWRRTASPPRRVAVPNWGTLRRPARNEQETGGAICDRLNFAYRLRVILLDELKRNVPPVARAARSEACAKRAARDGFSFYDLSRLVPLRTVSALPPSDARLALDRRGVPLCDLRRPRGGTGLGRGRLSGPSDRTYARIPTIPTPAPSSFSRPPP